MLNRYRRSGKYFSGSPSSFPTAAIPITVPTGWGDGGLVKIWTTGAARETAMAATKQEIKSNLLRIAAKYVTDFALTVPAAPGSVSRQIAAVDYVALVRTPDFLLDIDFTGRPEIKLVIHHEQLGFRFRSQFRELPRRGVEGG